MGEKGAHIMTPFFKTNVYFYMCIRISGKIYMKCNRIISSYNANFYFPLFTFQHCLHFSIITIHQFPMAYKKYTVTSSQGKKQRKILKENTQYVVSSCLYTVILPFTFFFFMHSNMKEDTSLGTDFQL